ncbi:MAG TPA: hypothetical protein VHZ97_24840 [Pseudonocardiaceae bacterium]|nr:hypothetical protein [Pseudonocardiaceae bacterium]
MIALAVGAVLGVSGPLLLAAGGSFGQVANLVLAAGWAWAAMAFCVGLGQQTRRESVALAVVSLVAAVIAYYVTTLVQGGFVRADLNDPTGRTVRLDWTGFFTETVLWCIAAVVLGSVLGFAANLARRPGMRGLPFRALVPLVAVVDTSMRLRSRAPLQPAVDATTWTVIRLVAGGVILLLIVYAALLNQRSTRS